jgi:hypothetical protein
MGGNEPQGEERGKKTYLLGLPYGTRTLKLRLRME